MTEEEILDRVNQVDALCQKLGITIYTGSDNYLYVMEEHNRVLGSFRLNRAYDNGELDPLDYLPTIHKIKLDK